MSKFGKLTGFTILCSISLRENFLSLSAIRANCKLASNFLVPKLISTVGIVFSQNPFERSQRDFARVKSTENKSHDTNISLKNTKEKEKKRILNVQNRDSLKFQPLHYVTIAILYPYKTYCLAQYVGFNHFQYPFSDPVSIPIKDYSMLDI